MVIYWVIVQVTDVSSAAAWRLPANQKGHWDAMAEILDKGKRISPLFGVPGVVTECVRLDWLHVCDQGVCADYMANVFIMCLPKLEGNNEKDRVKSLWARIQMFYDRDEVCDRLGNLTVGMLKAKKKPPKLRCSAAQCRALVPFAKELGDLLLSDDIPEEAAARTGMQHLERCYSCLARDTIFFADTLREHSLKFALQYVALNSLSADRKWTIKPKLHLFLHLCSDGSHPSLCWNYRDEDFGGTVVKLSRRRGGLLSVASSSRNLLRRFSMKQPMLRII